MNNAIGSIVINPTVNMNAENMSDEHLHLFERALGDLDGAGFTPLLYIGSQLVAGQLHAYIAVRSLLRPQGALKSLVKVVIYQSLNNEVSVHALGEI